MGVFICCWVPSCSDVPVSTFHFTRIIGMNQSQHNSAHGGLFCIGNKPRRESSRKGLNHRAGNGEGTLSQGVVEPVQTERVEGLQTWGEISRLPSLSALLGVSTGDAAIRDVTRATIPPSLHQGVSPPLTSLPCPRGPSTSSSSTKRVRAASSGPSKEEEAG